MAKLSSYDRLIRTVTRDVTNHPRDLTRYYMDLLNISRAAASKHIRRLETEGWIARSGPLTHPVFSSGYKRRISKMYKLSGLEEDRVWANDFKPYFEFKDNVRNIVIFGFTEMLNNAIDHSTGENVFVWLTSDESKVFIVISDDGVGIFSKIAVELGLSDMRQALFELSKGKFTTAPDKHSGEGVFFTSRMFDLFEIEANNLRFSHQDARPKDIIHELQGSEKIFESGTAVIMSIELNSNRQPADIYAQFANSPEELNFSKTIIPMKLAQFGDEQLVSRSQAKRLIARFDRFKTVVLNFEGVTEIGQAFADELFRVYGNSHPDVEIVPVGMSKQIEQMWQRVKSESN